MAEGSSDAAEIRPTPTKVVARSFVGGRVALGLDVPLELRGGDRVGCDAVPSELALDWQPSLVSVVAEACRSQCASRSPWFQLPPLALVGPSGCGRTLVARTLARCGGVPMVSLDVAGPSGAERLGRIATRPETALPFFPVLAMASTRCANPIVFVTGVDDATEETTHALKVMMGPTTAGTWVDESLEATVDLGGITWLLQTTGKAIDHPTLAPVLRSVELIATVRLDGHALDLLTLGVITEALANLGLDAEHLTNGMLALVANLRDHRHTTVAQFYHHVEQTVLRLSGAD